MTRRRTALIIDDEPDITTYLGTILSDNDWEVRTANRAEDGLILAREEAPDLVLLDVLMPERGGLSTLIALRKDPSLSSIPVILVTGIQESLTADFSAFLDRFKHYHPDAYLEKPVTPEQLMSVVHEVTQRSPAS
ncbi:MAG: response regulator [Acidobacteria bacterium]|jgi:CheY-like chemotaxis protein|nr:response regulator [Acidobacteriota bacterium]